MTDFVLDNCITMRWMFDGVAHPHAEGVLRDLTSLANDALVPILWRYEVSAVLARGQNRGVLSAQEVALFLEELDSLPITVDDDGGDRIFTDVHRVAVTHQVTSYDAAYLELAIRRGLPLATLDQDLIAASHRAGVPVLP